MFGRTLGGATTSSFQGILVLVISLLFGFRPHLSMIIPALVFMILISLVFTAFGTAIGTKLEDMQGFQLIMNLVIMPVFFLSGALFPLDSAPTVLRWIAYFNPLSYGVDGLRAVLNGASHFSVWTDLGVLVAISLVFVGIGAWLFSKIKA
jgi:ABC-2 type transport system permease protein